MSPATKKPAAKARPKRRPASKSWRQKKAISARKLTGLPVRPWVAWFVVAAMAILASLPPLLSLKAPADPKMTQPIAESALCSRSCTADYVSCRQISGRIEVAIERCEIKKEVCIRACLPALPPEPKPLTPLECAGLYCQPALDACLESAVGEPGALACEKRHFNCLSRCHYASRNGSGSPVPVASGDQGVLLPSASGPTIEGIREAAQSVLFQLQPIKANIRQIESAGLTVPPELTAVMAEAQAISDESEQATRLTQLLKQDVPKRLEEVAATIDKEGLLLERLANLDDINRRIETELKSHDSRLDNDRIQLNKRPDLDLGLYLNDYGLLLETAKTSWKKAKEMLAEGRSAGGIDLLQTGVADNIKEMDAIHRSLIWALTPGPAVDEMANDLQINRDTVSWLQNGGLDYAPPAAFLDELEAKVTQLADIAKSEPFDAPAFFKASKELVDLDELFDAAVAESRSVFDPTLLDSGLGSLPTIILPPL